MLCRRHIWRSCDHRQGVDRGAASRIAAGESPLHEMWHAGAHAARARPYTALRPADAAACAPLGGWALYRSDDRVGHAARRMQVGVSPSEARWVNYKKPTGGARSAGAKPRRPNSRAFMQSLNKGRAGRQRPPATLEANGKPNTRCPALPAVIAVWGPTAPGTLQHRTQRGPNGSSGKTSSSHDHISFEVSSHRRPGRGQTNALA